MHPTYVPLFSLRLHHDYFPQGVCPVLEIVPTPTTAALLQKFGARGVKRETGIELFRQDDRPLVGAAPGAAHSLTFFLRPTDPLFFNYTGGMPDEPAFVPFNPQTELPAGAQSGDIGQYTVQLAADGSSTGEFRLLFTARSSVWRYHLIDQRATGSERYELLDEQSGEVVDQTGDQPVIKSLPDGSEATLLTSSSPLPFRKRPEQKFTLRTYAATAAAGNTISLPAADANQLRVDPEDSTRFYSDIFVYL